MPVTKSAKKALRTAERRHEENLTIKNAYKKAIKSVKKEVQAGGEAIVSLFSKAQSALGRAAKSKTIHPNKAARLTSRLAKKLTPPEAVPVAAKATKAAPKKAVRKPAAKKA